MSCAAHDWRPATGWYARYRCELFGVFGYKQPFIRTDEAGPAPGAFASDRVTPYLCSSNRGGQKCKRPAIAKDGRPWKCVEHRRRGSTMSQRTEVLRAEEIDPPDGKSASLET